MAVKRKKEEAAWADWPVLLMRMRHLFYLESWTRYGFNTESDRENLINYIFLQPTGCESSQKNARNLSVNDDQYFWQAPR